MNNNSLTNFVESVCNESHLRVETDLGDGFVRLKSEEAERRQAAHDIRTCEDALIELLRNARDAHAHTLFVATSKSNGIRSLLVIDDGDGIPESMQELIFEPRVTSKLDTIHFDKWGVHGRGMALYAVKQNAQACGVVCSQLEKGTALFANFDTSRITEKMDQSSFPTFSFQEEKRVVIKGPKNIMRTCCEFAFEHRDSLAVYLGSPAEIAATLYAYGQATLSVLDRTFIQNENDVTLIKRLALAPDETSFCATAEALGLSLSVRTAYRIMGGSLKPLPSLLEYIQNALLFQKNAQAKGNQEKKEAQKQTAQVQHLASKQKPVSFTHEELQEFTSQVKTCYKQLADSYYLTSNVEVSAQVRDNQLIVKIPLAPGE
jgi:hypothetical protein